MPPPSPPRLRRAHAFHEAFDDHLRINLFEAGLLDGDVARHGFEDDNDSVMSDASDIVNNFGHRVNAQRPEDFLVDVMRE